MKKCLEQRVEDLEKEIQKLKSKDSLPTSDYMYNPSLNILCEPELETAFASPFDFTEMQKNPLDTLCKTVSSLSDSWFSTSDIKFNFNEQGNSPYPDILGSWDSNVCDEYGFKYNYDDVINNSGFMVSEFDLMDKDFLEWLNSKEVKHLYDKFKSRKSNYENIS